MGMEMDMGGRWRWRGKRRWARKGNGVEREMGWARNWRWKGDAMGREIVMGWRWGGKWKRDTNGDGEGNGDGREI
jgi:hypothetical protein